jgi:hypothetical protein
MGPDSKYLILDFCYGQQSLLGKVGFDKSA